MDRPSFETQFRSVFGEQFASLFRSLNRISGDPDLAADVSQEAFVLLYQRGAMPEDVRVWLFTVASNLVRDTHRTGVRRRELLERRAREADDGNTPDVDLTQAERREQVRAVLGSLSSRDQQMLVLRHEGYSYREIAAVLGIAEGSVGTLLARARGLPLFLSSETRCT